MIRNKNITHTLTNSDSSRELQSENQMLRSELKNLAAMVDSYIGDRNSINGVSLHFYLIINRAVKQAKRCTS